MATILPIQNPSVEASLTSLPTWQTALKQAVRSGDALCRRLGVAREHANAAAEEDFPVFAPLEYIQRMKPGAPQDPLLRQVLGIRAEVAPRADQGLLDPVGDLQCGRSNGMLQKYTRRVLLIASGACAVHCRYCFRRHFPYSEIAVGREAWASWLQQIRDDVSIDEVILSGGDPLSVVDATLAWFVHELNQIPHVRRLRVHTRFPVVIPQRVCSDLLSWIADSRAAIYVVVHINHAQEIDANVTQMFSALRLAGATLLNQAVLLKDVNDSVEAQTDLCLQLTDHHVVPYYLHQLDRVQGALHFEVSDDRARTIRDQLRATLPGYAVPQLVREIHGENSKTPL